MNNGLSGKDGDTVKLLRECDSGIKMGISSIEDVLGDVSNNNFKQLLTDCKSEHQMLAVEIDHLLADHNDDGKDPNAVAKTMSWMKTNMKMMVEPNDSTIADLMTDGCNMGVKSLSKYLNKYKSADQKSKDITNRLIGIESALSTDIRQYL